MKVLLIHNSYLHEGGEERVLDNLENLLRSKHHETFRFEHPSRDWRNDPWWKRVLYGLQLIYSFDTAHRLAQAIDRIKPDVAHVQNVFPILSPSVYYVLRRFRVPVVQSIHNYRFLCANGLFMTPDNEICERCTRGNFWYAVRFGCYGNSRIHSIPMALSLTLHRLIRTFEKCIHRFIVSSEFVKGKLIQAGFPGQRIVLIRNPTPSVDRGFSPRADKPLFVYFGRHAREKGLWTLLDAFQDSDLGQLKILGGGPLTLAIRDYLQARRLPHVELLGRVPQETLIQLLDQAWATLVPSECYEVAPQVVVESWQHGTPVIASRLGGLGEMIVENVNGWTFTPGHADDLKRLIRSLLQEPARLQKAWSGCRDYVLRHYDPDQIYAQTLAAYQSAIKECGAALPLHG